MIHGPAGKGWQSQVDVTAQRQGALGLRKAAEAGRKGNYLPIVPVTAKLSKAFAFICIRGTRI